jgi:DNA-binding NarL/FixJ family response regulator
LVAGLGAIIRPPWYLVTVANFATNMRASTPNGAMGNSAAAGPAVLFFIDSQRTGRDCISERLASLLSEWRVEPMSEAGELNAHAYWAPSSLLVLNMRGRSMGNPEVAGEMAMLAKLAPAVPILIMSELCNAREVTLAFGLGARAYLPTSLAISEVTAIVRFVAGGGIYVPANVLSALSETRRSAPAQTPDDTMGPLQFCAAPAAGVGAAERGQIKQSDRS